MWTLLLSSLKPSATKVAALQAGVIVVILLYAFNQHDQLKTERSRLAVAEVALLHPKTVTKEVIKTVQGPTKTVYKYVWKPDGTKESTVEQFSEGFSESRDSSAKSDPSSVDKVAGKSIMTRQSRWLAGLDLKDFSPNSYHSYTLYAGFSFQNRLDLLAGARIDGGVEPHLMAVVRF